MLLAAQSEQLQGLSLIWAVLELASRGWRSITMPIKAAANGPMTEVTAWWITP